MANNRFSNSYRMHRVFRADRAALVVPIDHGLVWGRVPAARSTRAGDEALPEGRRDRLHGFDRHRQAVGSRTGAEQPDGPHPRHRRLLAHRHTRRPAQACLWPRSKMPCALALTA